jgi:hypothetical protein
MTDVRNQPDDDAAAAASSEEGGTGFGAAFQERAAGDKPAGTDQEGRDEGANRSDAAPASDTNAEPGKTPGEAAPSDQEAAEGTSATVKTEPWYAGLSPEIRQRVERLETSERSQRGRVGALTKKLQRLSSASPAAVATGDRPAGESGASSKEAEGGSGGDIGAVKAGDRAAALEEKLSGVVKDFPELAVLQEVVADVRREIDSIKATAEKVETDLDAKEMTAAYQTLEQAHPDYAALAADKDFLGWVGDQPDSVIALANSWNPREVSLVFTLFKAERQAAQAGTSGDGGNADDGGANSNDATDARRKRQLEGSRDAAGRGASAAAGVPDDFRAAFAARSKAASAK